ncbi:sentrin-specific protease 6-like isoform X2 [Stigmatopora nigra]
MANNSGHLLHALERSEARPDGGYKHKWSFLPGAGPEDDDEEEEEEREEREQREPRSGAVTSSPGTELPLCESSRGHWSPPTRPSPPADTLRTYEKRSLSLAGHKKLSLNWGAGGSALGPSQGLVLRGRHFQHAQMTPGTAKAVHRHDSGGGVGEAARVDDIVLTRPDVPGDGGDDIKRLVLQKRKLSEMAAISEKPCTKCRKACQACPSPRAPLRAQSVQAPAGASCRCPGGARQPPGGRRKTASRPDRPIVLSSDDEAEDGAPGPADGVSPRPADSAHSSPAPCESGGEVSDAYFEDLDVQMVIPRPGLARGQPGGGGRGDREEASFPLPPEVATPQKRPFKEDSAKCSSIVLRCRSIRVGTLRRTVTEPVVFSVEHIQLEMEGPEPKTSERVLLRASELVGCEWCSVRKLPVMFFQTTPGECVRLRSQLNMAATADAGGHWYDCQGQQTDEKYVVLIFADGLDVKEQTILEDILSDIGRNNRLDDFPSKLPFDEANVRLVNFNKAAKLKRDKGVAAPRLPVTRSFNGTFLERENPEVADLQPTFSGPVVRLMVYPPPPAKGGISVTNEDLHCLNEGEFLNDVIIDFYLKYLVLEKLKKEDSQRIHVFSSFFYRRLTQREKSGGGAAPERTGNIPIPKRKHNRVKTWTRHVDLFDKDFVFVPINESAHWYLAVICFPGAQLPPEELRDWPPSPVERSPRLGDLHRISLAYSDEDAATLDERGSDQVPAVDRAPPGDLALTSPDRYSDDGALPAEDASDSGRPSDVDPGKRSCILIMDSLRGPTRSTVVKTLREYLEVEWEVRKGGARSFDKNVIKGSSPRVPQQDNFSDCGIYVLQYVESFFENPIGSFRPPLNLYEWFPQQRVKSKRQEIASLILRLGAQQEARHKREEPERRETLSSSSPPPPAR